MKKLNSPQPILPGLVRPNWICSNRKQAVLILADCSGSMVGEPIDQASIAIEDLACKLAIPENKDSFYVGITEFNEQAHIIRRIIKATELVGHLPQMTARGCTDMASALNCAKSQIDSENLPKLENATWLEPVFIFTSDGNHNTGDNPITIADELKKQATIVTIAYGNHADEDLLLKLATSSQHNFHCRDGVEIREFMANLGDTLTNSFTTRTNTADEIAKMDR